MNGLNESIHTFEYPSTNTPGSHNSKPDLNLVHPGSFGGGKMQVEPTVSLKPSVDPFMPVGRVIIRDQVQV